MLLRNSGTRWQDLSVQELFSVIYAEFKETCHRFGHNDPEKVLDEWLSQSAILSTSNDGDAKWADADRRALANLAKQLDG